MTETDVVSSLVEKSAQYLWAHPNSRTEFAIPSGYTSFTATGIGPSYNSSGQPISAYGSWKYMVEVDGKTLLESNELRSYSGHELPIVVTFPAGSKRLTLITDNAGDGSSDHAFWAYPTLLSAGSQKLPAAATVSAHAPALLFPPKKLPEAAIRTSTLSTARIPPERRGAKFSLRFINIMPERVKIYWLTKDNQHLYREMRPGDEYVVNTYEGDVWLIANAADATLACILGSTVHPVVVVDSAGSAAGSSSSKTTPNSPTQ